MPESTKIAFQHRQINQISDFTELIVMLFPGNRNQQYAGACIFFELKWIHQVIPDVTYMETKYGISRRILQRTRAKLSRLGIIEHISYLNSRYGGQHGWKLASRFGTTLKQLAERYTAVRSKTVSSQEKDWLLLELTSSRRVTKQLLQPRS